MRPPDGADSPADRPLRHGWLIRAATQRLVQTYATINPKFAYDGSHKPRRMLVRPSQEVCNDTHDNAQGDLIVHVGQVFTSETGRRYCVEDLQGQGAFGYVFRVRVPEGGVLAVKCVKNKPNYFNQALTEINLLQLVNKAQLERGVDAVVRMHEYFVYRRHLCLAFELLGPNLYDHLRQRALQGVSLPFVRSVCAQLLEALALLGSLGVIHCDLKPENVLLASAHEGAHAGGGGTRVKLIDLGSAIRERADARSQHKVRQTYVQSRFYRAPEVLLGMRFGRPIDMWSLGCICAELFLGCPLFPGESEFHQLHLVSRQRGLPPVHQLEQGRLTARYCTPVPSQPAAADAAAHRGQAGAARAQFRLRCEHELARCSSPKARADARAGANPRTRAGLGVEQAKPREDALQLAESAASGELPCLCARNSLPVSGEPGPESSHHRSLGATFRRAMLSAHARAARELPASSSAPASPVPERASSREAELAEVEQLSDFVEGLLNVDADLRWDPLQAARHPFVSAEPSARSMGAVADPPEAAAACGGEAPSAPERTSRGGSIVAASSAAASCEPAVALYPSADLESPEAASEAARAANAPQQEPAATTERALAERAADRCCASRGQPQPLLPSADASDSAELQLRQLRVHADNSASEPTPAQPLGVQQSAIACGEAGGEGSDCEVACRPHRGASPATVLSHRPTFAAAGARASGGSESGGTESEISLLLAMSTGQYTTPLGPESPPQLPVAEDAALMANHCSPCARKWGRSSPPPAAYGEGASAYMT